MGMMGNFYAGGDQVSAEDRARIRQRQASHDWYLSGMDKWSGAYDESAMLGWLNERTGRNNISPWVNTKDSDRQATWDAIRSGDYNAFLGSEGGFQNDKATLGSRNEGYRDDSIAAWFKNAFAGDDMVQHRRKALDTLNYWNTNGGDPSKASYDMEDGTGRMIKLDSPYAYSGSGGQGINKATTRMSKKFFDEMGLGDKFGLTWSEPEPGASGTSNSASGGGLSQAAQMLSNGYGGASSAGNGEMTYANPNQNPGDPSWLDQFREADRNGAGGRAGEMLRGGLMSGGGDAVRDVIYGKAQEKIFGE